VLVGEWSLRATPPGGEPWPGEARAVFEWMKGHRFLVERFKIEMPEFPDGVCVIGEADDHDGFRQYYFDSRGVRRIYEMTLADGVWKLWRDDPDPFPQRFVGEISADGATIAARWEKAEDGSSFTTDFDLTYRRLSSAGEE